MLTLSQATELINAGIQPTPLIKRWRGVYYGISLHTTGACPRFYFSNMLGSAYVDGNTGNTVEPPGYYGPEYQTLFDQFLLSRHPKETPAARNWRYSQYRPYTRDPFLRVMEVVGGAIFQDSNYSLNLANKADQDYVWGPNFSGYDLIQYFSWTLSCVFEDPNGYFLRIPNKPYNETNGAVEPEVWFIQSKEIQYLDKTDFIFCRGGYTWWVNTTTIMRFKETDPGSGPTKWELADVGGYYAHMLGYLPIDVAGGIWNNQGFFDSWLVKAKAAADDFISAKSAAQFVDKEASHPFIIQAQEDCPACNGLGHKQEPCDTCEGGMELVVCSSCKGSGGASQNPGDRMLVPREYMKDDLVKLVSPDTAINDYHSRNNKEIFALMLDALNLLRIDEAQSGLAKTIDQERLYQFVSKVSNDVFGRLIDHSVRDIIAYRNVTVVDGVTRPAIYDYVLVKPSQYRIKTSSDLLQDYNMASMAKVPDFIRVRLLSDFVDKIFGGDDVMKRKSDLIGQMDVICTYTLADKIDLLTSGGIQQKDFQFSLQLPTILDQIVREKGSAWFLESSYDDISKEVQRIFVLLYQEPTATQTPNAVSGQPKQQTPQQRLNYGGQ